MHWHFCPPEVVNTKLSQSAFKEILELPDSVMSFPHALALLDAACATPGQIPNLRSSVLLRQGQQNAEKISGLYCINISDTISVLDLVGIGQIWGKHWCSATTEPVQSGFIYNPRQLKEIWPFFLPKLHKQGGTLWSCILLLAQGVD